MTARARASGVAARYDLLLVEILAGNVVFRHFAGVNFAPFLIIGFFHAGNCVSFERVSFFDQFINAFGVGAGPS
jgi:hypothetical protein